MEHVAAPTSPPFCPNPRCKFHGHHRGWRWVRDGFYERQATPQRIQRFRCCHCQRHFSTQTFSTTYWLKRPQLLEPIFHGLISCSCLRQLARAHDISPQTALLFANRIGRHCLLFHERLRPKAPMREPQVLDSFQSFEYSQYHPTLYHLMLGKDSHFCHGFTDTELRRSGAMTNSQKHRRAHLEQLWGRPDPRSTETEVARLLRTICAEPQPLVIHSDEHQDYPRAFRRVPHLTIDHRTTSSRAARIPQNPLFAVNLFDGLIRHSEANHKRETIAFAKRRQMAIWRLWQLVVWRNYMKSFSERKRDASPAMRLGVTKRRFTAQEVLQKRLFVTRVELPAPWREYYFGEVPTREVPNGRRHQLSYAA